jgi:hypothetical protein
MDWIRANKSLAAIIGVATAGALGLAVVLYLSYDAYGVSYDSFQATSNKVAGMEKAKLYPSEANVEAKDEKVSAYEDEVSKLGGVLTAMQAEVASKPIQDTEFQARLKQRIAEIRDKAGPRLPGKDFAFGFDPYIRALPSNEATQDLNEYLSGVDAIVSTALDLGTKKIVTLTRSELEVEKTGVKKKRLPPPPPPSKPALKTKKGKGKGPAPAPKPPPVMKVVERRVVTMDIITDQGPLQSFLNALASASQMKQFTVVRLLRIDNEKTEGPTTKAAVATGNGGLQPINRDGLVTPVAADTTPTPGINDAAAAAAKTEVITAAKPEKPDAVKVLGGEELRVHLEIDLVRFLEPEAEPAK